MNDKEEYELFIRKVADSQYNDIVNGIHPSSGLDISIQILIIYYEKIEEYEKCDVLKKILNEK